MAEDILRKRLAAAKAEIEKKAGIKFNREYLALADLISEFVFIKTNDASLSKEELKQPVHTIGQPVAGHVVDDPMYSLP